MTAGRRERAHCGGTGQFARAPVGGQLTRRAARFRREAQAAAQLADHPGIVGCRDIGEADGKVYFAMDLVEGRSLEQLIDAGDLEHRQAAPTAV